MDIYLIGLFLFAANFILKSIPRALVRNYGVDMFTHLHIIRAITANGRLPKRLNGFLVDEYYDAPLAYPFLMHLILASFPISLVERGERFIGPLISSLDVLVVYSFVLILHQPPPVALYTAVLYSIAPVVFRAVPHLTPKIFGILFVNAALASMIAFSLGPGWMLFAVGVIMGTGIFFVHKFTAQAFLVGALSVLIAADQRIKILAALGLIILLLVVPLRSLYWKRILRDHIAIWKWHCHRPRELPANRIRLLLGEFWNTPLIISLVAFFIYDSSFFLGDPLYRMLIAWAAGLYLMAWATKYIVRLRFLGEGDRYKCYAAFPLAFLTVCYWYQNPSPWALALLVGFGFLSLAGMGREFVLLMKDPPNSVESVKDVKTLSDKLRNMPKDNVYALGGNSLQVLWWSGKKVFGALNAKAFSSEPDIFGVSVLRKPYTYIINKFHINYIFIDDHFFDLSQMDLGSCEEIAREGHCHLLEVLQEDVP